MDKAYKTSIIADYFVEDELVKRIGLSKSYWDEVIIKELIDNALDSIEPLPEKYVDVCCGINGISIFDNGSGISKETVKNIYDFNYYVSKNRHFVTASRGKQGNGLKTIISICFINKWRLLWHTNDNVILEAMIDADRAKDGVIDVNFKEIGTTDKRGVEIMGFTPHNDNYYKTYLYYYGVCNPDVTFCLNYLGMEYQKKATTEPVDKSKNISLSFYDYDNYKRFIRDTQDGNITYKQFLGEYFGTRIKNASQIKCKIKDIDFGSDEFIKDFLSLKDSQQSKKYTLLKNQTIGLENVINTNMIIEDGDSNIGLNDRVIPCIIEFSVHKNTFKNDSDKKSTVDIECYINNTITYKDGWSISFSGGYYKIGNKTKYATNLYELLADYNNFSFTFHIISPYLRFLDAGKTEIDISSFFNELLEKLNKAIAKENRAFSSENKKPNNRAVMRNYVTDAFNLASNNGKYAVTARQIWYKLREIASIAESKNTYSDFTQNILTEWIDENPECEDKVNFSDRGNFYVDGSQIGLGTANVRSFINTLGSSSNTFDCYGGISNTMHIEANFDLEYKYDKVLYIEKTGFDAIFKAEKVGEKYNMIIVSGQGFSTRAAKTLLYEVHRRGLKLYCLHDLDISGVFIFDSFKNVNAKFKYEIPIEDLGVTFEDVERYGIEPERVDIKKEDTNKLQSLPYKYQRFFDGGDKYKRVELNAFTTEQMLEILERKLSSINNLPTINLEESLNIDHNAIKQAAFMRVMADRYKNQLDNIHVPIDLSVYNGRYTVAMAKKEIPKIEKQLISQYEREIEQKLNIS